MNDIETGWLSPSGEFIPCEMYEHYSVAHELVCKLSLNEETDPYIMPDDILYCNGFVKISRETFCGHSYIINWNRTLTDLQKNFLRHIFENTNNIISTSCIARWQKEYDGR